jgi:hypothetical protein
MISVTRWVLLACLALAPLVARAEPPVVEHQPSPCTLPAKAISLCADITDDEQVAKARIYFRAAGEKFYNFVDMTFLGLKFCGTLPAPIEGRAKSIEYYVQGVDNQFEAQRTSTFQLAVQAECEFPPTETDAARAGAITVYATNVKQGRKLDDAFDSTGVTFVPVAGK